MPTNDDPSQTLNATHAGPDLFAALAKAQAQVETVGKDAKNTQQRYAYASAEAMIRGSRRPLGDNGLALLTTWSRQPVADVGGDIGNQFVCANVRLEFILSHASGQYLTGRAEMDAIGSRARPPDKAVAATLTYMHGFVLRSLLNMDRAEEDSDAVDRRDETGGWQRGNAGQSHPDARRSPEPPRAATRTVTPAAEDPAVVAARTFTRELASKYVEACKTAGVAPEFEAVAAEAIGQTFNRSADYSLEQWRNIGLRLGAAITAVNSLSVGDDEGPPNDWQPLTRPEDESQAEPDPPKRKRGAK